MTRDHTVSGSMANCAASACCRRTRGLGGRCAVRLGVGFTDIVKRATATAAELRPDEIEHGTPLLRQKLDETGLTLVIFTFPKDVEEAVRQGGAHRFLWAQCRRWRDLLRDARPLRETRAAGRAAE